MTDSRKDDREDFRDGLTASWFIPALVATVVYGLWMGVFENRVLIPLRNRFFRKPGEKPVEVDDLATFRRSAIATLAALPFTIMMVGCIWILAIYKYIRNYGRKH